jgi:hypothetical protein
LSPCSGVFSGEGEEFTSSYKEVTMVTIVIESILTTPFMNGVWTAMIGYFVFVVFMASLIILKNWTKKQLGK